MNLTDKIVEELRKYDVLPQYTSPESYSLHTIRAVVDKVISESLPEQKGEINLEEVEKLVQYKVDMTGPMYTTEKIHQKELAELRIKIGYTLSDLPTNTKQDGMV